jgi:hypothetical protein
LSGAAQLLAVPLGTSFTYQGRLNSGGTPANGSFNMTFTLFDAATGGTQIGAPVSISNVAVANGLFTVTLDFGATAFAGEERWLQIAVNGTSLSPRQKLTATPYALHAKGVSSPLHLLSTLDATATIRGQANSNNDNAIGVEGFAQSGSAQTIGVRGESISSNGRGMLGVASAISGTTYGGYFEANSPNGAGVFGLHGATTGSTAGVRGRTDSLTGANPFIGLPLGAACGVEGIVAPTSPGFFSAGVRGINNGTGTLGVGVAGFHLGSGVGVYGRVANAAGYAGYFDGRGFFQGSVGIGTGAPQNPLHVAGGGGAGFNLGNGIHLGHDTSGHAHLELVTGGGTPYLDFSNDNTADFDARIILLDDNVLAVDGATLRVPVLQITGGADLAEPFKVMAADESERIAPGHVVSIDPHRPGQLTLAAQGYDRKVAGIISGANGLATGMIMRAQGDTHADGDQPVALTGRVWCWCDASYGAIECGDLLTTSDTPGHAMKIGDYSRAPGATIGKAMTPLASGRGMVLVLVSLQ